MFAVVVSLKTANTEVIRGDLTVSTNNLLYGPSNEQVFGCSNLFKNELMENY